jgi:hypothetical protein
MFQKPTKDTEKARQDHTTVQISTVSMSRILSARFHGEGSTNVWRRQFRFRPQVTRPLQRQTMPQTHVQMQFDCSGPCSSVLDGVVCGTQASTRNLISPSPLSRTAQVWAFFQKPRNIVQQYHFGRSEKSPGPILLHMLSQGIMRTVRRAVSTESDRWLPSASRLPICVDDMQLDLLHSSEARCAWAAWISRWTNGAQQNAAIDYAVNGIMKAVSLIRVSPMIGIGPVTPISVLSCGQRDTRGLSSDLIMSWRQSRRRKFCSGESATGRWGANVCAQAIETAVFSVAHGRQLNCSHFRYL